MAKAGVFFISFGSFFGPAPAVDHFGDRHMSHSHHSGHSDSHHHVEPLPLAPLPPASNPPTHERPRVAGHPAPAHTTPPVANHSIHPRGHFHPLPVIGHAEAFYLKHIQQAEAAGDHHAKASHKVGQHVTSALDPNLTWEQKLKRFMHCLDHYCVAPAAADESLATFYHKLADLVRRHAGQEAMHVGRKHHEEYQKRLRSGESRETIDNDAEKFFFHLLGHGAQPVWCSKEAWAHLTAWRDHWV